MWSSVFRVYIIDKRVDMEVVFFASHIGERRRLVYFGRWTPDKEVPVLIGKEVYIKTIIQNFQSHIRLVIGQTATHAETFVISLLTVSFIGEKIDPSTNVEITDTTGVGEVETFVNRIPYST